MTTHENLTSSAGATPYQGADFVSTDTAALAAHMSHCAHTRSRFFSLHAKLESVHSLVFPRMITAAVIAVVLLGVVGTV